ncbi:MAG: hypothetical protein GTO46_03645 [Gemmatimonadetes bacterium]|nr:hypothetical protein [Gemmatimonadota bacterium]NIO32894.1 hypothetical protein [Gemmatimonadota bacterium]
MGGINLARVLVGGLLAGVIYNISGFGATHVVDLADSFARFGWEPSTGSTIQHVAVRFGFGLISVFTYAAIRPRFGPGIKTAVIAASIIWVAAAAPLIFVLTELFVFSGSQAVTLLVWTLVEAWLGTAVGAWLYQELESRGVETG